MPVTHGNNSKVIKKRRNILKVKMNALQNKNKNPFGGKSIASASKCNLWTLAGVLPLATKIWKEILESERSDAELSTYNATSFVMLGKMGRFSIVEWIMFWKGKGMGEIDTGKTIAEN